MKRVTAKALDQLDRLEVDSHLYFHAVDGPPDAFRGPGAQRALLVFLCPSEGPQTPADWSTVRRVCQGRGIGRYGITYLFTRVGVKSMDLPSHPDPVGLCPDADTALSAALRWVERPWRERGGVGKSGHVVLCHGTPWKPHTTGGRMLAERQAVLWSALRTFKHPARYVGRGVNPLLPHPVPDLRTTWANPAPDGGPGVSPACTAWWATPRT